MHPAHPARPRRHAAVARFAVAIITGALAVALASAGPASAAFPGANGKLAYASQDAVSPNNWVMNADGFGRTYLTSSTEYETDPDFSPDGSRIAYTRGAAIWVMNADGTGQTYLTAGSGPAWSPDGGRIAFSRYRNGNWDVVVMNADGSGQTALTDHPRWDGSASWSPDGRRIAFASDRDGNLAVYVMQPDGSGQTNMRRKAGIDTGPDWSPDGSRIAFTSRRDGTGTTRRSDVFVMNADGSGQTNLTDANGEEWAASWSPDGSRIAYSATPLSNSEVFVMNADGSGQTNVTRLVDEDYGPDWQTVPAADLAVGMVAVAKANKPLTYTIRVQNDGPSNAGGVVVTDHLPANAQFVSASSSHGSCQTPPLGGTGSVRCELGFLPRDPGAAAEIRVKITVPRRSSVTNTATVTSATPDPDVADNTATVTTTVR